MILVLLLSQDIESYQKELERIDSSIAEIENKLKELRSKERNILKELTLISTQIDQYLAKKDVLTKQIEQLSQEISIIRSRISILKKEIEETRRKLTKGAVLLYKIPDRNIWQLILETGSFFRSYTKEVALASILSYYRRIVKSLKEKEKELSNLENKLEHRLSVLNSRKVELERVLTELESKRRKHSALLERIRKSRKDREAYLKELRKARRKLVRIIEQLMSSKAKGKLKPIKLIMPVEGEVINNFGYIKDKIYGTKLRNTGIDIKAPPGSPVRASTNGKVVYVGWIEGYGNIIILESEGFYTVYANLARVLVSKGENVLKGQQIGIMGDSPLHFELRIGMKAVDPMPYFE